MKGSVWLDMVVELRMQYCRDQVSRRATPQHYGHGTPARLLVAQLVALHACLVGWTIQEYFNE